MGRKDYTKFAKPKDVDQIVEATTIQEVEDIVSEPVFVDEPVKETKTGVVEGCAKLNVRKAPNASADVVCIIAGGAEVVIDEDESSEDFYKICTVSGVEGYCMRKFIAIR